MVVRTIGRRDGFERLIKITDATRFELDSRDSGRRSGNEDRRLTFVRSNRLQPANDFGSEIDDMPVSGAGKLEFVMRDNHAAVYPPTRPLLQFATARF